MARRLTSSEKSAREAARNFARQASVLSREQQRAERAAQRQAARDLKKLQKLFKNKPRPKRGPIAYQFRKLSRQARGIKRQYKKEYAQRKHRAEVIYGTPSVNTASLIRRYFREVGPNFDRTSAAYDWLLLNPSKIPIIIERIQKRRAQLATGKYTHMTAAQWAREFADIPDIPIEATYYNAIS